MKVRTLIVDDEALARERLAQLLGKEPQIEIIGECSDGREAVAAIDEKKPDLVFLDIQMPEMDGFAVLDALEVDPMPAIVFVTAFDKYALKAFEVQALDYLLKPFDKERFASALSRALEQVKLRANPPEPAAVLDEPTAPPKPVDRLSIKTDGRIIIVKTADISWIQAAHNYVEIHEGPKTHLLRGTISAIETRLAPEKFVRISRSLIVNVDYIKELEPQFYGEYIVTLRDGSRLTLSRRYRNKLPQLGVG